MGRNETLSCLPFWVCLCHLPITGCLIYITALPGSANARVSEFQSQGEAEPVGLGLKDPLTLNPETSGQIIWVDDLCQVRAHAPGLVGEACV